MGIRTAALLILAYCTDGAEIRHHAVIRYDEICCIYNVYAMLGGALKIH